MSRISTIDIIANAEASLVYPAESRSRPWRPQWLKRLAHARPRLTKVLFGLLSLLVVSLFIIAIWLWFAHRPPAGSAVYLGSAAALLGAFKIIVMLRPHHVLHHLAATRRARLAPTRNVMKPVLTREMAAERIAARHAYRQTMDRSHCVHGWRWLHADARGAVLTSGVLYVVVGAITLWTGTISLLVLAVVAGGLATTMYTFLRTRLFPNLSKFTDMQRATNHCPHCDYDLSSVEPDQSLLREGIHAGPPRCPECGTHYPLLPPPTPEEVMCWDRRIRRSFEPPAWWRTRETR